MCRGFVTRLALLITFLLFGGGCGGDTSTGTVVTVNQSNFRSIVTASKRPVLIEFWSNSCEPCKVLEPHLASIAHKHQELLVVKINSDENPGLAEDLGVRLLPTLFIYQDGEEKRRKIGLDNPDELDELVSAYISSK